MSERAAERGGNAPGRPWLTPSAALTRYAVPLAGGLGRNHADAVAGRDHAGVRYGYRIADLGFLIGERVGCEVIARPAIARLPTTPAWLLGIANLRGSLVPIFDIRGVLELPAGPAAEDRFALIFDRGDSCVGLLVGEYPQPLHALESLTPAPPLPPAARDFITNTFRQGRSVWLEFDHRRFFESLAQRMAAHT